jgi:hypothetical protein
LLATAWPEPPSAIPAEPSAGVGDGMEAFAFGGTETPPNGAGEEEGGVQAALNLPGYSGELRFPLAARAEQDPIRHAVSHCRSAGRVACP